MRANADVDSLCSRSLVENHLDGLFESKEAQKLDTTDPEASKALPDTSLPTAEDEELAAANASMSDWISRAGRQDRSFESGSRKRTSDMRVSRTDPDATPMRLGKGETRLGYQTHYAIDGGKARVILATLVTPSEVTENRPMLDLLWRTIFRWQLRPHHVTGDAKYGTRENIAGVEKICPAGEHLHWRARNSGARGAMYRARAQACNACELKKRCTDSHNGRTVYRPRDEDYYDRVRAYRGAFVYEKALRKRKVWIEPLFAEAKGWHEMRRFRLRGLEKVNIEALLVAAGQNIKRILTFGSRGPKE